MQLSRILFSLVIFCSLFLTAKGQNKCHPAVDSINLIVEYYTGCVIFHTPQIEYLKNQCVKTFVLYGDDQLYKADSTIYKEANSPKPVILFPGGPSMTKSPYSPLPNLFVKYLTHYLSTAKFSNNSNPLGYRHFTTDCANGLVE